MIRSLLPAALAASLAPLLVACSGAGEAVPVEDSTAVSDRQGRIEQRRRLDDRRLPEQVAAADAGGEAVTGEVPEAVMERVMAALEKLTGADRASFEVVRSEQTVWPNGALGCPQPGMMYTQATIPGYHVVLAHEGREYDYRTGEERYLMLCPGQSAEETAPGSAPPRS